MKFAKIFFTAATLLLGFTSTAQDDTDRECKRMRFLAGEAVNASNYIEATKYYHLAEKICGGFDDANFQRLIGSLTNAINGITVEAQKLPYLDSINSAYDRQEAAGFYDQASDLVRASFLLQVENPNRKKADTLFRRGIKSSGVETHEGYVSYFYYNAYMIYYEATKEEQKELKQHMISDYFEMSALISEAKMSPQTQEGITTYFFYVVETCEDLLPAIPNFIKALPTEKDAKILKLNEMLTLLDTKGCKTSKEFMQLLDLLIIEDPNSIETLLRKASMLDCGEAMAIYRQVQDISTDADQKNEMAYNIVYCLYKMGSYSSAYSAAMNVGGKFKGDALVIASDCVAKRWDSCGSSTFDRKCNFLYASQLASQAQANGGNVGNRVASYRASGPSKDECFQEGNPSSVTLTCYGVSVSPCN